jgi:acyl carrier protein
LAVLAGAQASHVNLKSEFRGILTKEEQTLDTLTQIFRDVLDDDELVLKRELTAKDVDGWDSLTHIRLLVTIERKFNIKFTLPEVRELKNIGELTDLIQAKTALS